MGKIKVDTKELDRMIKKIKKVSDMLPGGAVGLSPTMKQALDRVGAKILKIVQKETPISEDTRPDFHEGSQFHTDKTHLRDSWRWKIKIHGNVVEGYTHVTKGKLDDLIDLLEAGSPRHFIGAEPGSVLRFYKREGGTWKKVYAKFVPEHPGFTPNKFTKRAQDKSNAHIKELVSVMQHEINAIILGK